MCEERDMKYQKVKIALNPLQTYQYPIMNWKGIKVTAQVTYGGEDSEAVPCGFVTNLVYTKTKRSKKNANYRKNKKAHALAKLGRSLSGIVTKS